MDDLPGGSAGDRSADAAALDRIADPAFAVDADWRLTDVNAAAAALADAEPAALVGAELWTALPAAVAADLEPTYRAAAAGGERTVVDVGPIDGRPDAAFELRLYPVAAGGGGRAEGADGKPAGLSALLIDVSDREDAPTASAAPAGGTDAGNGAAADRPIADYVDTLREMYEVIADTDRSIERKVEAMLRIGRAELGVEYGTLSRIRGDDYVFEVVDATDDAVAAGDVAPLSATVCEHAVSTERTLALGDLSADAPELAARAGSVELGMNCYLGAPVIVDGDVYGTFCFYGRSVREEPFTDWQVTMVDLMARWMSYELERERAADRLRRQNERLDGFASVVSHDLRNPLNVLDGSLDLARETGDDVHFDRARRAVDRMEALIDDLLDLARAGRLVEETEPVDLAELATDCRDAVPTGGATVETVGERTIRADESRLRQLLENLIRNSVEHGSTGGRPEADNGVEHGSTGSRAEPDGSAEHADPDAAAASTVTVGPLDDGFYVEDDGPGIPAEDRERVFESGYSTAEDGTGFGLAIVRRIAEAHSWSVTLAESEAGGARFEFTGVERIR